jgi:hypothetical protein
MTGIVIRKAERHQARLRLGLCGPSGSGKTYSALRSRRGWWRALRARSA